MLLDSSQILDARKILLRIMNLFKFKKKWADGAKILFENAIKEFLRIFNSLLQSFEEQLIKLHRNLKARDVFESPHEFRVTAKRVALEYLRI